MLTVEELVAQYDTYSDKELYNVHVNMEGYSPEAREALEKIIRKRGGLDALSARLKAQLTAEAEQARIRWETGMMGRKGVDASFLKTTLQSTILSPQQVHEIIDEAYQELELEKEDKKIKPRTIIGGLIGTLLAAVVGGVLCGLYLIYSPDRFPGKIILILFFGLIMVCYGIIKLVTRQSWNNIIVLICSILSIVLSIAIGQLVADLSKLL